MLSSIGNKFKLTPWQWAGLYTAFWIYLVFVQLTFDRNDNMYAAASVIQGQLYNGVYYVQAPLSYFYLQLINWLSPEYHTYLALRIVTSTLLWVSLLLVLRTIPSHASRLWALIFFAGSHYVYGIGAEIGSYVIPLLFSLAALLVLRHSISIVSLATASLLIGLATSSKLNYALLFLCLLPALVSFSRGQSFQTLFTAVIGCALGGLIGLSPILYYLWLEPEKFLLLNIEFHAHYTNALRGMDWQKSSENILKAVRKWLLSGDGVLFIIAAYWFWQIARQRQATLFSITLFSAVIVSWVAAATPGIIYAQYLFPASVFGLWFFFLHLDFDKLRHSKTLCAVVVIFTVINIVKIPYRTYLAATTPLPMVEVEQFNQKLRHLSNTFVYDDKCQRSLFTLMGALAVDSSFTLHPASIGGIFWPRLQPVVNKSPAQDPIHQLPDYLIYPQTLIQHRTVDFLLAGFYSKPVEQELVKAAEASGYRSVYVGDFESRPLYLYFSPECMMKH